MTTATVSEQHGFARHEVNALAVLNVFYRVPRAGVLRLADCGGPFGFDITVALQVDHLVRAYDCDALIETGCFLGDTTEYLARRYSALPIQTCDIDPRHAAFTATRTAGMPNVTVRNGDSAQLLKQMASGFARPLIYLDAHWGETWPLRDELNATGRAIVVIDDFDIGHERFGFDHYDGAVCGPQMVHDCLPTLPRLWVGNPYAPYPLPCLQTGRRSGTGFLPLGLDPTPLRSDMFIPIQLGHPITMPDWATITRWGGDQT